VLPRHDDLQPGLFFAKKPDAENPAIPVIVTIL